MPELTRDEVPRKRHGGEWRIRTVTVEIEMTVGGIDDEGSVLNQALDALRAIRVDGGKQPVIKSATVR